MRGNASVEGFGTPLRIRSSFNPFNPIFVFCYWKTVNRSQKQNPISRIIGHDHIKLSRIWEISNAEAFRCTLRWHYFSRHKYRLRGSGKPKIFFISATVVPLAKKPVYSKNKELILFERLRVPFVAGGQFERTRFCLSNDRENVVALTSFS